MPLGPRASQMLTVPSQPLAAGRLPCRGGGATPRRETNGQPRWAIHAQRLARLPRLVAGKLKIFDPLQEIGKRDPGFQSCQRRTKAGMDAVAERQVRVGIAGDVKAVRIVELPGITVGGAHHRKNKLSSWDHLAMHLDVSRCRARHPLQRRPVAQGLLDRRGEELRRRPQPGKLLRVIEEAQDQVVDISR